MHNSYIDSTLVKTLRANLAPCIDQYHTPHAVIQADNMLTFNEYLLVPVKYVLNGKSHVVKLRLTILPMSEGNQIIIGLPGLAGPLSDLFVDMAHNLKEITRQATLSSSAPSDPSFSRYT